MNPIINTLTEYFATGQRVTCIEPDDRIKPKAIIVHLEGGTEEKHSIDTLDRSQFMDLWKEASAWWHFQWERFDE